MSAAPKAEAKYDFSATKLPDAFPDLKCSGDLKNVTAVSPRPVTVKKRDKVKVDIIPDTTNNITFLFIKPSEYSSECRRLICRPAGSSSRVPTTPIEEGHQHGGETGKGGYQSGESYPPDTSQKYPDETGKGGYQSGESYPPDTSQKYPDETGKGGYPKKNPPPPPPEYSGTECDFTWNKPDDPSDLTGYFTVQKDPKDKRKGVSYISYQGQQTQTMPPPAKAGGETRPRPPQPPGPISTPGSVEINLENDLFLIGHSVIGLLGPVNTLEFENELDKDVSIQVVMGYPIDRPSI
jgi:hypothetical protein